MEVKIFHTNSHLKVIRFFCTNKNNNKKVKVSLEISDSLTSDNGYLYVKDNLQVTVNSVSWNIPII